MKERIFFYDYSMGQWAEDRDEMRLGEEAENIPLAYLLDHGGLWESDRRGKAWCPEHRKWEWITDMSFHEMTTETGCHIKGIIVKIDDKARPVRWRVSYLPSTGTVTAIVDTAGFSEMEIGSSITSLADLYAFAQKWHWRGVDCRLSCQNQEDRGGNWKDLPQCVMDAVIDFLLDVAEPIYGRRPSVWHLSQPGKGDAWLCTIENSERIKALTKYPLDMRLYFLENCQSSNLFAQGYGLRDSRENFPWICYEFGLKPTQELWEDYGINPYRLRICAILKQLGIRSHDIARKFYRLHEFCLTKWTSETSESNSNAIGFPRDFSYEPNYLYTQTSYHLKRFSPWQAFVFYCLWRLSGSTEGALAKHLLEQQERWCHYYSRSMVYFAQYFSCFPKSLREKIYQEGFTRENHNQMVEIINTGKTARTTFSRTEAENEYECEIDGYVFRWLTSEEEFFLLNRRFGASLEGVLEGKAVDLANTMMIFRQGEHQGHLCCGDREFKIASAAGKEDYTKIWIACLHWLKWTGLFEKYHSYSEEDYAVLDEDVHPNPLPKQKTGQEMTLYDWMHLPEKQRREDYYQKLARAFIDWGIKPLLPGEIDRTKDEKTWLMAVLPYGKEIYEAAFAGCSDAQAALAILYKQRYESCVVFDQERADDWMDKARGNVDGGESL